jgi:hypothetical protein
MVRFTSVKHGAHFLGKRANCAESLRQQAVLPSWFGVPEFICHQM